MFNASSRYFAVMLPSCGRYWLLFRRCAAAMCFYVAGISPLCCRYFASSLQLFAAILAPFRFYFAAIRRYFVVIHHYYNLVLLFAAICCYLVRIKLPGTAI